MEAHTTFFPPKEQVEKLLEAQGGQPLKPVRPLWTIGYGGRDWDDFEAALSAEFRLRLGRVRPYALVMDARFSPRSRKAAFGYGLEDNLWYAGYKYLHVQALGNRNYKQAGAAIQLNNVVIGMGALLPHLTDEDALPAVLLCGCRRHEGCHRWYIANLAAALLEDLQTIHIP